MDRWPRSSIDLLLASSLSRAANSARAAPRLRTALTRSTTDEPIDGPDLQHEIELTYTDFCSCLAAIAMYRNSDPFIELPVKIEQLFHHMGLAR